MTTNLEKRALMIRAIRNFFETKGYLEVETPLRIPVTIPEDHIAPFTCEGWYLQSSPEICMKRLAARGYGKIFQICKCFRKDERGERHLSEMTLLEWYKRDFSYMELMDECRDMIRHAAKKTGNSLLVYGDHTICLDQEWEKIQVSHAFDRYSTMTMDEAVMSGSFDEIMAFDIEPNLGTQTPTFIYDYPASMAALARLKSHGVNESTSHGSALPEPRAERFELYIAGMELANGFSELTDPGEQRERFIKVIEAQKARTGKGNSYPDMKMPEKFLDDLKNMPPTAGIALGIDRLAMILSNAQTIDEVVAFPPEEL
ncbi:MAG: EF-P lysine aminoacylase GenX [Desulfamplus sp.]|nr:EF-P lysine aminoacylase GenX [Desulfamplus sp.]